MDVRKLFVTLCLATTYATSHTGAVRNGDGFRVPSSSTLSQGFFFFSGNYETLSDGSPMAIDGFENAGTGKEHEVPSNIPSAGGALQASYAPLDYFEFGIYQPFYYDGRIEDTDYQTTGFGDMQIYGKASLPTDFPLRPAISLEVFAPTGTKGAGFRPRRIWNIKDEETTTHAYTYGSWSVATTFFLTLELFEIVQWNTYIGHFGTEYVMWGTGFNLFPYKLISVVLEVSGETKISPSRFRNHLEKDGFRFSPAVKLHLPQEFNLLLGVDLGLDYFRGTELRNGHQVTRENKGKDIHYTVSGTPKISMTVGISKAIDFSWKDADRDGVPDRLDMCPGSSREMVVNSRGCPVDEDQDGVLNIVDDCPGTPEGWKVNQFGCPLDNDRDGIPDEVDTCPDTELGETVNKDGCPIDTDGDGVSDLHDICADTPKDYPVDKNGCPLDTDKDGVPDAIDQCPKTPVGAVVDSAGCIMDSDFDGVPDHLDKCPTTLPKVHVDESGCARNTKQNLSSIAKEVKFFKNSDKLIASSYTALNDVITLMRKHNFTLEVIGPEGKINAIAEYLDGKGFDSKLVTLTPKAGDIKFIAVGVKYEESKQ